MAEADKVTLFRELDESGFRISVHVVSVKDAACFVIQVVDLKRSLPVHEEVCPPMKHYPRLFIHEDDLLSLEERTEEIMKRLLPPETPAAGNGAHGRGKVAVRPAAPLLSGG